MNQSAFNMVREIREKYDFNDEKVLDVMLRIPRDEFVEPEFKKSAYEDTPVEIGFGQTMSQPYTVAFMTGLVAGDKQRSVNKKTKILEIGTGSGYQAAVLSYLYDEVYSVEIVPGLAHSAKDTLERLGYKNIFIRSGSGEWGWKEHAPFDAVIITAGLDKVPGELFGQLKTGGVLVAPLGVGKDKIMTRFTKLQNAEANRLKREEFGIFNFVPFVST